MNTYVDFLKEVFPEFYNAYQLILTSVKISELEFKRGYPNIFISNPNQNPRVMVDFSSSCTFFLRHNGTDYTITGSNDSVTASKLNMPKTIPLDEAEKYVVQIVLANLMFDE